MLRPLSRVLIATLAFSACGRKVPAESPLTALTSEFVYSILALSPAAATAAGYHEHNGKSLDSQLDDYSTSGIAAQRQTLIDYQKRLAAIDASTLGPDEKVDLGIMQDQISLALLELDTIQNWRHNPTVYVEALGNALFTPYLLNYAPLPQRYQHIIARLDQIPAFLNAARANLQDSPEVWNRVAREENDGTIIDWNAQCLDFVAWPLVWAVGAPAGTFAPSSIHFRITATCSVLKRGPAGGITGCPFAPVTRNTNALLALSPTLTAGPP